MSGSVSGKVQDGPALASDEQYVSLRHSGVDCYLSAGGLEENVEVAAPISYSELAVGEMVALRDKDLG